MSLFTSLAGLILGGALSVASLAQAAPAPESAALPAERTSAHARWMFDSKAKIRSTAVISGDLVILGNEAGKLFALDRRDGRERWSLQTNGAISSELALAEGKVIFLNGAGEVMAVDAGQGRLAWSFATGTKESYRSWGHHLASAWIAGDRLYIGASNGKLYALAVTNGKPLWQMDLHGPVHTKPFVLGDVLYISSDTAVQAIRVADQKLLWQRELDMPTAPAVGQGVLVVGSRQAQVHGLDAATGAGRWVVSHGEHWVTGGPVIHAGRVHIGSSDDHRYQAIELASGKVEWQLGVGANVFSTPAFNGGVSYISSGNSYDEAGNGLVRAVDKQGEILWSFAGKNFFASPAVAGDTVFIGSDDGYFYALPAD